MGYIYTSLWFKNQLITGGVLLVYLHLFSRLFFSLSIVWIYPCTYCSLYSHHPVDLSVYVFLSLSLFLSTFIFLSVCQSISLSNSPPVCFFTCIFIVLAFYLYMFLYVCLSFFHFTYCVVKSEYLSHVFFVYNVCFLSICMFYFHICRCPSWYVDP